MTYITQLTCKESGFGSRIMAMALVVLGMIAMQSRPVHAQWATNGNNINNTNTGNVGIGTVAPNYRFDVQANTQWVARFKKTDATHGGIIVDAAAGYNPNLAMSVNGAIKWYMNSNSANSDTLQFWEATGQTARFTLTQAGNLGIGTASPAVKLDVAGALHVSGVCNAGVPNSQGTYVSWNQLGCGVGEADFINHQGGGTGGFWFANTANGTNLNSLMFISGDGNVGIGTNAPTKKLDVVGEVNVTGTHLECSH